LQVLPSPQVATPQQTPSVQKPVAHVVGSLHLSPRPIAGTQALPLQKYPAAQSEFPEQAPRHAIAPHA
jgi:hypothetical protein